MSDLSKKLKIRISSYNPKVLHLIIKTIKNEINGKYFLGPFNLPMKRKVFCVLRSPFVNKDSRDHFELRTYSSVFICKFNSVINLVKFLKLLFKKLSFEISNNLFIEIFKN